MRSKCLLVLVVLLLPASVFAQASLTGTVRDASGGVLPGVTVEASSPALIEKVRTAVTDDTGQYRIIDLRAGTYTLTFSLAGFTAVRRENIELAGSQTLTIPVDMRVGALQETITVTGETSVVDVQSARREVVIDRTLIQTIPASRAAGALLNATPGLTVDGNGIALSPTMTFFSANGGANNEGRMAVNGMTVGAARSGGVSSYVYDAVGVEEVSVRVGGGLGETDTGGPIMNIIPRSGGNTFSGTAFTSLAGDWSRGDNLNDELRGFGLTETPGIIQAHDASISLGGPIVRDRLWFYGQYRNLDTQTAVEGITANANAGDAARWDWMPSPVNARLVQDRMMAMGRFAGQVRKSRINVNYEYQKRCEGTPLKVDTQGCHNRGADWVGLGTTTQSPEATGSAARGYFEWPFHLTQGQWTMPLTNQLLLDASTTLFRYNPAFGFPPPDGITNLIPVTEQSSALRCNPDGTPISAASVGCTAANAATLRWAPSANYAYRALEQWGYAEGATNAYNAGASYVTGAHSLRVGYQGYWLRQLDETIAQDNQLAYRFNQGVPNRVTYRLPTRSNNTITQLHGVFAQDQYTRGRLTLSGAVRWDRASSYAPVEGNGVSRTSFLNPAVISFPETPGVDAYNDISPRAGVGYDVFGNGRTAVKLRWGKYLGFASNDPPFTSTNKGATIVATVNRDWTDNDGDKVVDCDLLDNAAQGPATGQVDTCAAVIGNDANFGKAGAATIVDPALLTGWGVRTFDYQTEVTLQQEVLPRVSAEVSYIHRTFHGFMVTDSLGRNYQTDWINYSINAPTDPRLPGGGNYPITVFLPNTTAATQNYLTRESTFGTDGEERNAFYDGVNFNVNARMRNGLFVSVGTQTGRRIDDRCDVVINFNNGTTGPNPRDCRQVNPWQTVVRGLGSYTLPKVDVVVSATVRSEAPLQMQANWQVPNTTIRTILNGTLPPGLNANGNSTIDLTDSDHLIFAGNRRTQVDMRFAKVLRFGRTRTDVGVDLWNLFNTNYATAYQGTYTNVAGQPLGGTWGNPTAIYAPRFVRLNFTVNF
ncbi:MAG TPA: TonB-dependent receptor [Vicinamibacterales bacterium]|nr:TonB-dependent receptor [Vicinamibacterales bacterium]